jgi:hypothetical protein
MFLMVLCSVTETPSIQASPHNVVVTFKKSNEGLWEVLPGVPSSRKKKKEEKRGTEQSPLTSPASSPATPSDAAEVSEIYLGAQTEVNVPMSCK